MELWREQHNALDKVTEKDIWQSNLGEEEREYLARARENNIEVQRGKESKKLRNAIVTGFYQGLYENSRDHDGGFER